MQPRDCSCKFTAEYQISHLWRLTWGQKARSKVRLLSQFWNDSSRIKSRATSDFPCNSTPFLILTHMFHLGQWLEPSPINIIATVVESPLLTVNSRTSALGAPPSVINQSKAKKWRRAQAHFCFEFTLTSGQNQRSRFKSLNNLQTVQPMPKEIALWDSESFSSRKTTFQKLLPRRTAKSNCQVKGHYIETFSQQLTR